MKKTIYFCDQCGKELDSNLGLAHLSINFGPDSGRVYYDNQSKHWKFKTSVLGIKQFCDENCMIKFINRSDYLSINPINNIKSLEQINKRTD